MEPSASGQAGEVERERREREERERGRRERERERINLFVDDGILGNPIQCGWRKCGERERVLGAMWSTQGHPAAAAAQVTNPARTCCCSSSSVSF